MNQREIEILKSEQKLIDELMLKDTTSSQTTAKPPVGSSTVKEYYLCSGAVIEHFPELEKSKIFKSGYEWDNDSEYYVIATTDYKRIEKYFNEVIEPFNEKSNVPDIDFWLRPCCESLIDIDGLTKNICKEAGVIIAIERKIGLTAERNVAFAIYALAKKYNYSPIQFINRVVK